MPVERLLLVVRDPVDLREVERSRLLGSGAGSERALCLVQGGDPSGLNHLGLQQCMTVELRARLGAEAEAIPTFVVSGRAGDDVDTCAAQWGATRVIDLRRSGAR